MLFVSTLETLSVDAILQQERARLSLTRWRSFRGAWLEFRVCEVQIRQKPHASVGCSFSSPLHPLTAIRCCSSSSFAVTVDSPPSESVSVPFICSLDSEEGLCAGAAGSLGWRGKRVKVSSLLAGPPKGCEQDDREAHPPLPPPLRARWAVFYLPPSRWVSSTDSEPPSSLPSRPILPFSLVQSIY